MTTIVERRRPPPTLPDELWTQIFSHFGIIDKATTSDAQAWADVTNIDDNSLHRVDLDFTRGIIAGNIQTKVRLSSVSRLFRTFTRPSLFELIEIRSYGALLALSRNVKKSGAFADCLTRYTLRLDIMLVFAPSSKQA